jgi:hypothetical protein
MCGLLELNTRTKVAKNEPSYLNLCDKLNPRYSHGWRDRRLVYYCFQVGRNERALPHTRSDTLMH